MFTILNYLKIFFNLTIGSFYIYLGIDKIFEYDKKVNENML